MNISSTRQGAPRLPAAPLAAASGDATTAARLNAAGVDVIVAYHSSPLRLRGLSSVAGLLPWGNANEITLNIVPQVTAAVTGRPVFATVCANDALHPASTMVTELAGLGVDGVLNAPTVGLFTGPVRRTLEEAGLGFQCEIDLVVLARERGLRAWAYAFTPEQARELAKAGAEAIIVHLGITGSGQAMSTAASTLTRTGDAARAVDPQIRILAHGGPIRDPASFTALGGELKNSSNASYGFFGASALELADDIGRTVKAWRAVLKPDTTIH